MESDAGERHGSVLWISGWASALSTKREFLEKQFPKIEHYFLDFPDLLKPGKLSAALDHFPSATVIAWSLGGLELVRWGEGINNRPMLLLGTPASFCHQDFGYGKAVLRKMQRELEKDLRATLDSFAGLMGLDSASEKDRWIKTAEKMSVDDLGKGLDLLAKDMVSGRRWKNCTVFLGQDDQVVRPEQAELFRQLMPEAKICEIQSARHWILSKEWMEKVGDEL